VTGLPTPYFVQVEKSIRTKFEEGEAIEIKDFLFSQWALQPPEKNAEQKVEDINLKLGEIKEGQEDLPLTEKELKIYTTVDWLREIGDAYSNVLPQNVLDNTKASKESKVWAQYEIARSKGDILPGTSLYKINTEDNDDTIINYYQQWQARQRITSLAELKEYDKLYPKSYLGNVTRQQYALLKNYLEAEDKKGFLETHSELKVNPRDEWLKENPKENALLSLGGQAKILSMEAYKEFNKLVKELDIPDDAIPPLTLPPDEKTAQSHFDYLKAVSDFSAGSAEAKLVLTDPDYDKWRDDLQTPDQPARYYELQAKNRAEREYYESLGDKEQPDTYMPSDTKEEQLAKRAKFFEEFPESEYFDDLSRIEAISKKFPDDQIEAWVERGKSSDEFGGSSPQAKLWAFDNMDAYRSALKQELIKDEGALPDDERNPLYDAWSYDAVKLQVDTYEENKHWQSLGDKENPEYIEDMKDRWAKFAEEYPGSNLRLDLERVEAFEKFFTPEEANTWAERGELAFEFSPNSAEVKVWAFDNRDLYDKAVKKEMLTSDITDWNEPALRLDVQWREKDTEYQEILDKYPGSPPEQAQEVAEFLAKPENVEYVTARFQRNGYELGLLDENNDKWVEYSQFPTYGDWQKRFQLNNPEWVKAVNEGRIAKGQKPWEIVTEAKPEAYDTIYEKYKDLFEQYENVTGTSEERTLARQDIFSQNPAFKEAYYRRKALGDFWEEKYVRNYVTYTLRPKKGYADERYLKTHMDFYLYAKEKLEWTEDIDFDLVPSEEVERLYNQYDDMRNRKVGQVALDDFRDAHRNLDAWGVLKFGWVPIEDKKRREGMTPQEKLHQELAENQREFEALLKGR